jgi:hypothetical protein
MDGQTLIASSMGSEKAQLDIRMLAPGCYFVEATTVKERMIGRFVKL